MDLPVGLTSISSKAIVEENREQIQNVFEGAAELSSRFRCTVQKEEWLARVEVCTDSEFVWQRGGFAFGFEWILAKLYLPSERDDR